MKHLFTFCFLQFLLLQLTAQNIRGTIADAMGKPTEFANVLLYENGGETFVKGTISDENGAFDFSNVKQGKYRLEVSMVGFKTLESVVFEIGEEQPVETFEFVLQEDREVLEEVAVTAKKPLFEQQIDRTIVNVQNSITPTDSTVLEVLERSSGIQIDRMNNQIVMRGKQGVIVMLNGKRTRMEAEGLIQLLQNMPSDNVQKIELITTSPASFDAEGNAGVINIVSSQSEEEGIQGNASVNRSYRMRPKYGASLNLQFRKKGFSLFADFSGSHDFSQHYTDIYRESTFREEVVTIDIASDRSAFTQLYTGRLGVDFEVSKRTTVGALFSDFLRNWDMEANTQTLVNDNRGNSLLNDLDAHEINEWRYWIGNVNLRHRFSEGNQLSFDFDYMDYFGDNPVSYNTVFASNPQVRSTINQQLSASYKYKRLLFNFEYVYRENPLTYQPKLLNDENLFVVNVNNIKGSQSAMLSANTPIQVTDWWESRYNLSAYWFRLQPIYEGKIITETDLYFNANIPQNFQLPKDFSVELSANLNSSRTWGLDNSTFRTTLNLGVQKKLSENAKLTFNWNDLFNLGSFFPFNFDQLDLNLIYKWNYDMEGNVFRLNFSWQFGNSKLKKVSERKTGSEEKRRRMN